MATVLNWHGFSRHKISAKAFFEDMAKVAEEDKVQSVLVIALNEHNDLGMFSNSPDSFEALFLASKAAHIILEDAGS